jgi:hypothetical protein
MLNIISYLTKNMKLAVIGSSGILLLIGLFITSNSMMNSSSRQSSAFPQHQSATQQTMSNMGAMPEMGGQQGQQQGQQQQQQGNDMGTLNAVANLQHTPTGSANLLYDATNHILTVTVSLSGLAPNSIHPAHIHPGSCAQPSGNQIVHSLNNMVADATGRASTTKAFTNVQGGIPAAGWYINVHNGPQVTTADQDVSISCGDVLNPQQATSVLLFMGPPVLQAGQTLSNEQATGFAALKLVQADNQAQLVVTITLQGLAPNSIHAAHIHTGSCFNTGGMLFDLTKVQPLQADAQGNVTQTIIIPNPQIANAPVKAIPASGWVINVHFSTQLGTQTGYNPILCAAVAPDALNK